ncbi:MAG: glycosyltransferase [Chloroflexi bacterium]|nr:glycosyltransferase [Chloroflexota bacterium]
MRILYVGHAYLVAENRKKLGELAQLPGVELTLVVPHRWPGTMHGDLPYDPLDETLYPVRPLRAFLAGRESVYGYWNIREAFSPSPVRNFPDGRGGRGVRQGVKAPDIICVEQGAGAFSFFQFLRARDRFAPSAKAVFFTWWNLPYRSRQPLRALEAFNLRHADGGIAGNADARDILRDHGFTGPLRVLPQLGVDPEVFCKRDASALRAELNLGSFVVGFAGRFVAEKGLRVLVEAALNLGKSIDLLLLGNGPLEAEVRERIAAHGSRVKLRVVNSVPHAEVARYLNCMDAFVLPSLTTTFWKEQFGHALIEAFACEVPVVGSSSAEIPNVVGDAGLIVPEGDAAALRDGLCRLADDPALRSDLARRGRARALALYTNRRLAESDYEFFKELVG